MFAGLAEIKVEVTVDLQNHVFSFYPIRFKKKKKNYAEQTLKMFFLLKIPAFPCDWLPRNICGFRHKIANERYFKSITLVSFISLKFMVGSSFK